MERLEELINRKREIFKYYRERIEVLQGASMNPEPEGTTNGAWMPTVVFDKTSGISREVLQTMFKRENIDARVFFYPLSSLPMFRNQFQNRFAFDIPGRAINLPSYHEMTLLQQECVTNVLAKNLERELK